MSLAIVGISDRLLVVGCSDRLLVVGISDRLLAGQVLGDLLHIAAVQGVVVTACDEEYDEISYGKASFDESEYKKYDPIAKEKIEKFLIEHFGWSKVITSTSGKVKDKYRYDLLMKDKNGNEVKVEVEIKKKWHGQRWPEDWGKMHVLWRKVNKIKSDAKINILLNMDNNFFAMTSL